MPTESPGLPFQYKWSYANDIVFVGDGYTIVDFVDGGKFDQDMNEGIGSIFSR